MLNGYKMRKEKKIEIYYLEDLNKKVVSFNKLNYIQFKFQKGSLSKDLKYLINFNIKNLQTYTLIKSIINLQKEYLYSNNILHLKYISQKEILNYHNKQFDIALISSNISTIINNTINLKEFVPKKYNVLYYHIKDILKDNINLTDKQIVKILQSKFNIIVNDKTIFRVRHRYQIPNKTNRKLNPYLKHQANYSKSHTLTFENIINLKNIKCVYELINNNTTVYIGSTKDLKRRMTQYISNLGHTEKLREFIQTHSMYFRYIENLDYKNLEKSVMEAFKFSYGEYPILNCYRVL